MTFENDPDTGTIQQFDFSVDLLKALLWQYNDAANLQSLLQSKSEWYETNQTQFWLDWYADIFNLATANDFGLSVWSVILNQPLYLNNGPSPPQQNIFGLGPNNQNLTNGNFGTQTGYTYYFSTETARLLLQLRYFQLVSSGTVPETNRMVAYLFESFGPVFLVDDLDMTQRYLFEFDIPSEMLLMLTSFDILPRAAGVKSNIQQANVVAFGLGPNNGNLNNSNFFNGEY
jgi:hypothetical protein